MKILFFDTETNGLPLSRNALTSDTEKWPYILQISWTLMDFSTNPEIFNTKTYYLELPPGITWNKESAVIHKISETTARSGKQTREVLMSLQEAMKSADVLVAHNLAFDKPVLRAAYYRLNANESFTWWPLLEYCTMENTKSLIKLPSKYAKPGDPWKYPRLTELYKYLFEKEADSSLLHTASGDVSLLITCFKELLTRRVVPFEAWVELLRVRELARNKKEK
jgi:DNA polymerase III epsilon subunit-like protein